MSRGFGARRRDDVDPLRIPPGQYYERGVSVLSAGPTPRTPLEEWTFWIDGRRRPGALVDVGRVLCAAGGGT
jgi:hypothetical protein